MWSDADVHVQVSATNDQCKSAKQVISTNYTGTILDSTNCAGNTYLLVKSYMEPNKAVKSKTDVVMTFL